MAEKSEKASSQTAEAQERRIISAQIVHEAVRKEGEEELARPTAALAWSGLGAGLSMGLSMIGQGVILSRIDSTPWRPLVVSLGYALGFIVVTLGRQQLFTEITLTAVIPALEQRKLATWLNVLRVWIVVLAANLAGAVAVGAFANTAAFQSEFLQAFNVIGHEAMSGGSWGHFLKAIPAGWLIALIVWLGPAAPSSRLWIALILSYVVGLGGFTHVVAGSIDGFYLVVAGQLHFASFALDYFLPVLAGNIAGGVVIVAVLNHAQATLSH